MTGWPLGIALLGVFANIAGLAVAITIAMKKSVLGLLLIALGWGLALVTILLELIGLPLPDSLIYMPLASGAWLFIGSYMIASDIRKKRKKTV